MRFNLPEPKVSWIWILIVPGAILIASLLLHFLARAM
jgi:hypothetical protein